jgi:hypothetical protein
VLTSAFLAADSGEMVGMRHLIGALALELQKTGRLINPADFGRYSSLLKA